MAPLPLTCDIKSPKILYAVIMDQIQKQTKELQPLMETCKIIYLIILLITTRHGTTKKYYQYTKTRLRTTSHVKHIQLSVPKTVCENVLLR